MNYMLDIVYDLFSLESIVGQILLLNIVTLIPAAIFLKYERYQRRYEATEKIAQLKEKLQIPTNAGPPEQKSSKDRAA